MAQTKYWQGRIDQMDKDLQEVRRKTKLACSYEHARNDAARPSTSQQASN